MKARSGVERGEPGLPSSGPRPACGRTAWLAGGVLALLGVVTSVAGAAAADEASPSGAGDSSGAASSATTGGGSAGPGTPVPAFRSGVPGDLIGGAPQRFSLSPEDLAPDAAERHGFHWDLALSTTARPMLLPGDALRGVRNSESSYTRKFARGTLLVTGAELTCGAILLALPRENTRWEEAPLERGLQHLEDAWTKPPVWDTDVFYHNWIGHPYAGAFYYNMIRSQGGTAWQSAKFALFQTLMWEYVVEAVAERPSIQDLVTTPVLGSLLGELFHRWSIGILRSGALSFGQKVLVFFLNPSYVINNGYRAPE